jgi:hypothetical protein
MMPASAGWTFPVVWQALAWHRRLSAGAARLALRSEEFLRRILLGMRFRPNSVHGRVQLDAGSHLEFSSGAVLAHDPAGFPGEPTGMSISARFGPTSAAPVESPTSDGLFAAWATSAVIGREPFPATGKFGPEAEAGRFAAPLTLQTGPLSLISTPVAGHPEFHSSRGTAEDGEDLQPTPATREGREGGGPRQEEGAAQPVPTYAAGIHTAGALHLQQAAQRATAAFAAPAAQPASLIEATARGLLPAAGARVLAPTPLDASGLRPHGLKPTVLGQPSVMALPSREPAETAGNSNLPAQDGADFATSESTDNCSAARGSALGVILRTKVERIFPKLDVAAVRVHTDGAADRSARALGADAFALGRDIFFRAGRFDLASAGGLALLGHELVHVQQFEEQIGASFFSNRSELEQQAAATERTLAAMPATSAPQPPGSALATGPGPSGGSGLVHAAPARSQTSLPLAAGHRPLPSSTSSSAPATAAVPVRGSQPLTAEAGRSEPPAAAATTGGEPEDIEDLARRLLRIIGRQLAVERERRGVDRWAR